MSHELTPCRCPYCGHKLDSVMAVTERGAGNPGMPDAGDLSACIACAQVLLFDDDLTLRKPRHGELKRIYREDPAYKKRLQCSIAAIKQMHGGTH